MLVGDLGEAMKIKNNCSLEKKIILTITVSVEGASKLMDTEKDEKNERSKSTVNDLEDCAMVRSKDSVYMIVKVFTKIVKNKESRDVLIDGDADHENKTKNTILQRISDVNRNTKRSSYIGADGDSEDAYTSDHETLNKQKKNEYKMDGSRSVSIVLTIIMPDDEGQDLSSTESLESIMYVIVRESRNMFMDGITAQTHRTKESLIELVSNVTKNSEHSSCMPFDGHMKGTTGDMMEFEDNADIYGSIPMALTIVVPDEHCCIMSCTESTCLMPVMINASQDAVIDGTANEIDKTMNNLIKLVSNRTKDTSLCIGSDGYSEGGSTFDHKATKMQQKKKSDMMIENEDKVDVSGCIPKILMIVEANDKDQVVPSSESLEFIKPDILKESQDAVKDGQLATSSVTNNNVCCLLLFFWITLSGFLFIQVNCTATTRDDANHNTTLQTIMLTSSTIKNDTRLILRSNPSFSHHRQVLTTLDDTNIHLAAYQWAKNKTLAESTYGPIQNWDISRVTNMNNMFGDKNPYWDGNYAWNHDVAFPADAFTKWDVSKVTDMSYAFWGTWTAFNGDLSQWNVSNVSSMEGMFAVTKIFNCDLSKWDTCKVTNMKNMFWNAQAFNQPLPWDTSRVTSMHTMFTEAFAFNGDISTWNTANVTSMTNMFKKDSSFNRDISKWRTTNVQDMSYLFLDASKFNQDLTPWDTRRVTDVSDIFYGARSFTYQLCWNIIRAKKSGNEWYGSGNKIGWSSTKCLLMDSNIQLAAYQWAKNKTLAESTYGPIQNWDTSRVTNMNNLFGDYNPYCDGNSTWNDVVAFPADAFTKWDVSKVTDMSYAFQGAVSFNGNLSTWDTSMVIDMTGMFSNASSYRGCISTRQTSKVTSMDSMFNLAMSFYCDISTWDTSQVSTFDNMFNGASSFRHELCWNTSRAVTRGMFYGSYGSFSLIPYPYCLFISKRPSSRPTIMPTVKPTTKRTLDAYWSPMYGNISNMSSTVLMKQESCPEGSKVISIEGKAASLVYQLKVTCDDVNHTSFGPLGTSENSNMEVTQLSPCDPEGYHGWIITYGSYIGQLMFTCDTSNNFTSTQVVYGKPLGQAKEQGAGITKSMNLTSNQGIVGFKVFYDSIGIRALSIKFTDFPSNKCFHMGKPTYKCVEINDRLAILWGFLTVMAFGGVAVCIILYLYRQHQKRTFQLFDTILPLK